jgi:hypothetical protein
MVCTALQYMGFFSMLLAGGVSDLTARSLDLDLARIPEWRADFHPDARAGAALFDSIEGGEPLETFIEETHGCHAGRVYARRHRAYKALHS